MSAVVHVIGGGLAGLSCAVEAARRGLRVSLHEAAPHLGGRCRSFFDRRLDRVIDNGTHLILSANRNLLDYCREIGGSGELIEHPAEFPFIDLADGTTWTVQPGGGRVPWWLLSRARRVPGSGLGAYLGLMTPWSPHPSETVAERWGRNPLYRRLIEPLSTAILNTEPEDASAALLHTVMRRTLGEGAAACRPLLAPHGLGAALVTPAVEWLRTGGVSLHVSDPLIALETGSGHVRALVFQKARVPLGPKDQVVLAVAPTAAHRLMPSVVPPMAMRTIVNAHYATPPDDAAWRALPPLLGIVGGLAQWVFVREGVVSVTLSRAGLPAAMESTALAERLWADVRRALGLHHKIFTPACRIIKERRATLAHSPGQEVLRPGPRTPFTNLWLAGDWTATGLPCTLEGAVQSGRWAARQAAEAP